VLQWGCSGSVRVRVRVSVSVSVSVSVRLRLGLVISVEYSQCALLSICALPSRIKCRP